MLAWSMPGSHRVLYPLIRFHRTKMSCRVCCRAWPMCREPVTLGGGMTMEKRGLVDLLSATKYPPASQTSYHLCSTGRGSQVFSIGAGIPSLYRQAHSLPLRHASGPGYNPGLGQNQRILLEKQIGVYLGSRARGTGVPPGGKRVSNLGSGTAMPGLACGMPRSHKAFSLGPLGGRKVHKMVKFRPAGMVDKREMKQPQLFE